MGEGGGGGGVSIASSESHRLPWVLALKKSSAVIPLVDFCINKVLSTSCKVGRAVFKAETLLVTHRLWISLVFINYSSF